MPSFVYYLGLSALLTHEMDAVQAQEWRLLYVLRGLPEAVAYPAFLLLHLPMIFVLLWLSHHPARRIRRGFRLLAAGFLVVHAGLHARLADDPLNGFEGVVSNGLIAAAGLCGGLYLLLRYLGRAGPERRSAEGGP